jgi:hypothetical protein
MPYRDPKPKELTSPLFESIWQAIKSWDINVPEEYSGYTGATGNHVCAILDVFTAALLRRDQQVRDEVLAQTADLEQELDIARNEMKALKAEQVRRDAEQRLEALIEVKRKCDEPLQVAGPLLIEDWLNAKIAALKAQVSK